jgi:cytochrome c oxidase subunit 2
MPSCLRPARRLLRVLAAIPLLLLLSGCDLNFWRMDGHQTTMIAEGPVARTQLDLFYVTVWVTLFIFVAVGAVLAYATLKFRARSEADEHAEPPAQSHGNPLIELGLIGASVLALVIIAIPTLSAIWSTYDVAETDRKDALEITATGYQWWFKFEYPSEMAALDSAGAKAPLVTGNELVIPAGRPIRIHLRTVDVNHSFWVPKLAGKVDMTPNRRNLLWLKADKPGYFWGQCAEYCGDSHAVMRFRVIALSPKDYAEWLQQQQGLAREVALKPADAAKPAAQVAALRTFRTNETGVSAKFDLDPLKSWQSKQLPEKGEDSALIAQGRQLFASKTCNACHTVRGHGAMGVQGPDLTHIGARSTVAAGLLENNTEQLRRWLRDPESVKPGNKMAKAYRDNKITLSDAEQVALVAYLESLK